MDTVKIVVFVPVPHSEKVRTAIGKAGGGKVGKYSYCSFSIKGTGRFKPEKEAKPAIGKVGKLEEVQEERIEFVCEKKKVNKVIQAIKKVHPYEEVDLHISPIISKEKI
jgi:hypothetical protein